MNIDADLLSLLDALAATGSPGWLGTAATLLEQSARSQHDLARMPRDLARQGRMDGRGHMMMYLLGDTSGALQVVVLATQAPDESKRSWSLEPELYLAAKKHQVGALRATMIIFDPTGTTIERVLFNNAINGPNTDLDAIAARMRPLESTPHTVPRPGRGKRNGGGRRR